ncbi:MAG TPA: hypothetical protein VLX31_05225 [Streptosporangiaceae bacterium]|nr:hypothetical protein [Streptosporangiaceae bacterium]
MTHDELGCQALLTPPEPASAVTVAAAPGPGRESWAGSPSAVRAGGEIVLAYRLRAPRRRGYAIVVARSADGVTFEPLVTIGKDEMACESLERPALLRTPDGTWRLYLSCATYGTKHWRVELVEADSPARFEPAARRVSCQATLRARSRTRSSCGTTGCGTCGPPCTRSPTLTRPTGWRPTMRPAPTG